MIILQIGDEIVCPNGQLCGRILIDVHAGDFITSENKCLSKNMLSLRNRLWLALT